MTFRAANTPVLAAGLTVVGTVPAGTVATDYVLVVTGWGSATTSTVTLTVPAGATVTTLIPSRNDGNMGWALHKVTGLVAGNTITSTLVLSNNKIQAMYCFTTDFGAVGAVGNRNGVTQSTTPAPALAIPSGQPMLIFGTERTTADGTTAVATSASGAAVTQLSFYENINDPDLTYYLGRFIAPSSAPGIATITYNSANTNGGAVQIIEVAPAITPSFGTPGLFTTEIEIPASPGVFRWWDESIAGSGVVGFAETGQVAAGTHTLTIPITGDTGILPGDTIFCLMSTTSGATLSLTDKTWTAVVANHADGNTHWGLHKRAWVAGDPMPRVVHSGTATATCFWIRGSVAPEVSAVVPIVGTDATGPMTVPGMVATRPGWRITLAVNRVTSTTNRPTVSGATVKALIPTAATSAALQQVITDTPIATAGATPDTVITFPEPRQLPGGGAVTLHTANGWRYVRAPQGLSGPQGLQGDASAPRLSPGYTVLKATTGPVPDGSAWGMGAWTVDAALSYPTADQCVEDGGNAGGSWPFRFRRAGIAVIHMFFAMNAGWMIDQRSIAWISRGVTHGVAYANIGSCPFNNGEICGGFTTMVKVEVGDLFSPAILKWSNNTEPWHATARVGLLAG